RFYAGAPLLTPDGFGLGALCVMDPTPQQFTTDQKSALSTLARVVMGELEQRRVAAELAVAGINVRTFRGVLPLCSYCKGIRDDHGYWLRLEAYIEKNTHAHMTHGICPECLKEFFPLIADEVLSDDGRRERRKLNRLLKSHSRLVAQAQGKAREI